MDVVIIRECRVCHGDGYTSVGSYAIDISPYRQKCTSCNGLGIIGVRTDVPSNLRIISNSQTEYYQPPKVNFGRIKF